MKHYVIKKVRSSVLHPQILRKIAKITEINRLLCRIKIVVSKICTFDPVKGLE